MRRAVKRLVGVAVGGVALALVLAGLAPTDARAQAHISVRELGPGVIALLPDEGSGNTLIVRGPAGSVIVDTMADTLAPEFLGTLERLGVDDVRYVVSTHWHQNHLGANGLIEGATLVGPERLRERLSEPQRLEFLVRRDYPALPESYRPSVTFTDSLALHVGGERVSLWHVRGHTDTDVIAYFPDRGVLATGDLWSPLGPFMADLDTGGSLYRVAEALVGVLDRVPEGTLILPGHAPPTGVPELRAYVEGLAATLAWVDARRRAGRSLAEVQAGPIPGPVGAFIRGNVRFLEAAYRSERAPGG